MNSYLYLSSGMTRKEALYLLSGLTQSPDSSHLSDAEISEKLQELNNGECTDDQACVERGCQECCEHDFDPDEGFTCLNCGKQGEPSDLYDEDYGQDR